MKKLSILILLFALTSDLSFSQRVFYIEDSIDIEIKNYLNYLVKKLDHDNIVLDSLILNTPKNPKLENYYKNTYKAEGYIMKRKYEKALQAYQTAFSFLEYPFRKDLYFALKCEMLSNRNPENIKQYIWFLVNKTADKDYFLNDSSYYDLPNWNEIKTMIEITNSSIDTILVEKLNQILEDDQNIRRKTQGNRSDSILFEMDKVDSINYYKILNILDEYPNISENLIDNSEFYAMSIVFTHESPRLDALIKMLPMVHSGNIDARKFADFIKRSHYLCDNLYFFSPNATFNLSSIITLSLDRDEVFREFIFPIKEEKVVNKFREKLYCESVDDMNKKLLWQFRNCKFDGDCFKFYGSDYGISEESVFFEEIDKTENSVGNKFKIYYRTKKDKQRISKAKKEYYKNNLKNVIDIK
jgi:hypothetical protein